MVGVGEFYAHGCYLICRAVKFHTEKLWLISAGMDLIIKVWNLQTSEVIANLQGHYSAPTDFVIDPVNTNILVR